MKIDLAPHHIGIIMDGNGRWAKKRNMPRPIGHREGAKAVKTIINAADDLKLSYLTLYVFSSENFQRPENEVTLLMKLFVEMMKKEFDELHAKNVRIHALGNLPKLPQSVLDSLNDSVNKTKNNTGLNLVLAFGYGGREEIIEGIKKLMATPNFKIEDLNEEKFQEYLYLPQIPDPELIIRTGGDQRLSNFLLWQSAYSEFYFTETLWPDFDKTEFISAIEDFRKRDRRFGKVSQE